MRSAPRTPLDLAPDLAFAFLTKNIRMKIRQHFPLLQLRRTSLVQHVVFEIAGDDVAAGVLYIWILVLCSIKGTVAGLAEGIGYF